VAGCIQNLKPWPKGVSGNPGGRPRKAPLSDVLTEMLQSSCTDDPAKRTYAEVIAEMLLKRACNGDIQAVREIADRVEGRPAQRVSVVTEECSTCREASDEFRRELESLTDEQLKILSETLEPELNALRQNEQSLLLTAPTRI
jgi:hypothetical protein